MLKKTITYTDLNGNTRTEGFYFNISRSELVEMETSVHGGYTEMINRIIASQDGPTIMKTFKEFILKSYGVKSDDGVRFIKSKELSEAFSQTEAYTELFMELCLDAGAASDFVNGILPKSLTKDVSSILKESKDENAQ